jgi:hypothetical protein
VGVDPAVELVPVGPIPVKVMPVGVVRVPGSDEAIELDRVVPASGKMSLCGNQFWLGTARAGLVVRFWIDCEWVHLSIGGARVKSLRSRFSVNDLDTLVAQGAVPAGEPPLPSKPGPGSRAGRTVVEVERTVSKVGTVSLGQRLILAAEILGGRRVGIYIEEGAPLLFFDPETRELLRTRPNPLEPGEAVRLQRTRPVGTLPHPSTEPIRVQRRANNSGVITVTGQKVALGRKHTYRTVTVHVSETTLAIELPDADTRVVRRTTTQPVRSIKAQRHQGRSSRPGPEPRRGCRRRGNRGRVASSNTSGRPGDLPVAGPSRRRVTIVAEDLGRLCPASSGLSWVRVEVPAPPPIVGMSEIHQATTRRLRDVASFAAEAVQPPCAAGGESIETGRQRPWRSWLGRTAERSIPRVSSSGNPMAERCTPST